MLSHSGTIAITILLFSCLLRASALTHPDNIELSVNQDLKLFGVRRGKGNLADKELNVDTLTNSQDNFGRAKNNLFHAIEEVEKKALHVAEQLVHDEVDILFGKDHGQPIHDEKMQKIDLELIKPVKVRRLSTTPSTRKIKMTTEYVKSTHPHETTELPHGNFLDFMENYANHCHSQFGY